jgi:hypothetical protein
MISIGLSGENQIVAFTANNNKQTNERTFFFSLVEGGFYLDL